MSDWTLILDRLERQLRRQERAFRRGDELPKALRLERSPQAMTPSESLRAVDLMQRTDALIDETLVFVRSRRRQIPTPYNS